MGWLSRGAEKGQERKDDSSLLRFFNPSIPDPEYPASTFLSHVENGWDRNELVYACIDKKATNLPQGTIRVYDSLGRRGEPLQDHPLRRLLANPNPLMSEFEMFEMLMVHLDLAGNAFWEIVRDRAGVPVELWPVRPDRIRMKRGTRSVAYGFALDSDKTIPIEVVHFKLPNPVDPMIGTPPLRPALRAVALDNEATSFVKSLLQNHAIPGVVVTMGQLESVLDEATTNRLKAKWKQSYGGRNRGEPAFLQTGMEVKELGLSLKDLEFPDLRTISESRICMAFKVPPIVVGAKVGLDRSTFANYGEAMRSFWQETLLSSQRRIRDTIAAQLLPLMPQGGPGTRRIVNVSLRWDNSEVEALRESEIDRWNRATQAFQAGGLMLNDYRREIGQAEVPGGDVFLMPSGVIATRDMAGAVESLNGQSDPASQPDVADVADEGAKSIETKAETLRSKAERDHERTLAGYFADRRADVLAQIGGKAVRVDKATWNGALTEALYGLGLSWSSEAGKAVSGAYDKGRTEAYQHRRAQNSAENINADLLKRAKDALTEADPKAAVGELFDEFEGSKSKAMATTIATETLAWGRTEAGRQAAHDSDAEVTKTWNTTSSRPRQSHASMNGETVGIDDKFSNGMNWPGDPAGGGDEVAGCTCDVTVTIEGEGNA